MKVSAHILKWLLRIYPPLLFQHVWVKYISADFSVIRVKLYKSFFNVNYNSTLFGGTIYAATDAFYPVMYHQLLTHAGYNVIVWIKSAQIQFLKPGRSALNFSFSLNNQEVAAVTQLLNTEGKTVRICSTEMFNNSGELCALVSIEVYIRNLDFIPDDNRRSN